MHDGVIDVSVMSRLAMVNYEQCCVMIMVHATHVMLLAKYKKLRDDNHILHMIDGPTDNNDDDEVNVLTMENDVYAISHKR